MQTRIGSALTMILLLSACQVQLEGVGTVKKETTTASKKEPKAVASSAPSASPRASVQPGPSASIPASLAPSEPTSLLKGSVRIDAAYLIGQAGGNLIGQAGGNVIATGGGNVISVGGGNVIANGGGNLISVGAGSLIGQAGGNYRALAADGLPLGTILPVKGMVVVPVSMLDDRQVGPAVFTDEKGQYTLSIPQSLTGLVRLYAAIPGKDENDPLLKNARLWYNLLGNADAADNLVIDEDTVKVSQMLRDTFREKFTYFMTLSSEAANSQGADGDDIVFGDDIPVVQQEAIKGIIKRIDAMVAKNGVTPAEVPLLSRRLADQLLTGLKFSDIKLNKTTAATWTGPDTPAMPVLVELIRDIRTRAQEKMLAGAIKADYASTITPQIEASNVIQANLNEQRKAKGEKTYNLLPPLRHPDFKIERPSDVSEFMVTEFLTAGSLEFERLDFLLDDLVRDGENKATMVPAYKQKIDAAGKAMAFYFGLELLKFANENDANGVNKLDALGAKFRADHPR